MKIRPRRMPPPRRLPARSPNPLDAYLPNPDFSERHRRTVHAPAEAVWEAATSVTPAEIRLLAPLMAARSVPHIFHGDRRRSSRAEDASFLDVFEAEGFLSLHRDTSVIDGRALTVFGAAGRFWSPTGNAPVPLGVAQAFAQHQDAGTVKVAFSLEVAGSHGCTEVTTETRIVGTDQNARRAFGRYWLIIRGPSGLIRRSWLAAIDRRARA